MSSRALEGQGLLAPVRDPLAYWFALLEQAGERVVFPVVVGGLDGAEQERHWVSHLSTDAAGAVARLLATRECGRIQGPSLAERWRRPGWPRLLVSSLGMVAAWRPNRAQWRPLPEAQPQPAEARGWFSRQQTEAIRAAARARGSTVGCLLLSVLHHQLMQVLLTDKSSNALWQLPINLRSPAERVAPGNRCSFIHIRLGRDEDPRSLRRRLVALLDRHVHWSTWLTGRLLPTYLPRLADAFVRGHYEAPVPLFMGAFSNLGVWSSEEDRGELWWFAPIVTRVRPIGVGTLTFNGRLAYMLQTHPCLGRSADELEAWSRSWRREVLALARGHIAG